jgi:putative tricarboxylic transport membrane protein
MKRVFQITAVALLVFSGFVIHESVQLRYYTRLGPGPGFFPLWLGILLSVLALCMFLDATLTESTSLPPDFFASRQGDMRDGAVLLSLVAAVLFLDIVGFRITMLCFYLWLLYALGRQNVLLAIAIAIAGSWGIYHVFASWLKVPLPIGVFGI